MTTAYRDGIETSHDSPIQVYKTRDSTGSVSDIAANGLKEPLSQHSIGARLDEVAIVNPPGLEVAVCSACVRPSLAAAAPKV